MDKTTSREFKAALREANKGAEAIRYLLEHYPGYVLRSFKDRECKIRTSILLDMPPIYTQRFSEIPSIVEELV